MVLSPMIEERTRSNDSPQANESLLRTALLFKDCDAAVISKIAPHIVSQSYPARATILKAGVSSDGIVIVCEGKASVVTQNATTGAMTTLETLQAGDHVGDLSALLRAAQPYAVIADTACTVVRIRSELVEMLLGKVPAFTLALAKRLAMRNIQLGVTALRGSTTAATSATQVVRPSTPDGKTIVFGEVSEFDPNAKLIAMIPSKLILQYKIFPLRFSGTTLTLGMVNPRNSVAIGDVQRLLNRVEVEVVAISVDDFLQSLLRFRVEAPSKEGSRGGNDAISAESLTFDVVDSEREPDKQLKVIGDEVVRALNRVIAAGISREASDIHMEPDTSGVRVRFRVHGMLQDWNENLPSSFARGLIARVKILAGLDITERRVPQDGRIGMTAGTRELDLRVSTMPTGRGEKVVIRLLDGAGMMRPLEQIFVDTNVLATARKAIQRPHGGILIAGGTGSGKSSSLYAMIHERRRARPDSNVLMVEDPIEFRLQGVTQVQVSQASGLGFSQVLRAALRQDPDVIVVGETRDRDTAHMALEAAMTGHLLLTSLHANDVASVLQRLEGLECSRTLISQSVATVMVQKLVRKLCSLCARVEAPLPAIAESLVAKKLLEKGSTASLPRAVGCDACQGTGYSGRVLVVETLQCTEKVRDAIIAGESLPEIERAALKEGAFVSFSAYASLLMARRMISPGEALLAVA
jgi:type IV pilus assembly protein PilB